MNKDKVACVILNYNDAENTLALVRQLADYCIIDYIIVVDNVSTDDSFERLKTLISEKITVTKSEKNGGYGYGNNYGIRIAKEIYGCKYAFVINSDVRCSEECLHGMLACFEMYPKCSVASGMQMKPDGSLIHNVAWFIPSAVRYMLSWLYVTNQIFPIKLAKIENQYERVDCVAGSCFCVDLEKFILVGGFDENIFLNCEETTLGIRMKKKGFEEYIVRDVYYQHFHSTGSVSSNLSFINRKKQLMKSRLYVMQNYLTESHILIALAKICFVVAIAEEYLKVPILYVMRLFKR